MKNWGFSKAKSATVTNERMGRWASALLITPWIVITPWIIPLAVGGCGASSGAGSRADDPNVTSAVIGKSGGELVGRMGTPLEGVSLTIPPNALAGDTELAITRIDPAQPLPNGAVACGPQFSLGPAGLSLAAPARLVLPVVGNKVTDLHRLPADVNVGAAAAGEWAKRPQIASADGSVTVMLDSLCTVTPEVTPPDEQDIIQFDLHPNPQFAPCFTEDPNKPARATVTVVRGELNDELFLVGENFKPKLQFDLFTVENSPLNANGEPIKFVNFGLAWYQTDLESDARGVMRVSIREHGRRNQGSRKRLRAGRIAAGTSGRPPSRPRTRLLAKR
jgi:hypothetical protein